MQFFKTFTVDVDESMLDLDFGGTITPIDDNFDFDFSTDIAIDLPTDWTVVTPQFAAPVLDLGFSSVSGSASAGVSNDGEVFAQAEGSVVGNASLDLSATAISFDAFAFDIF